MSDPRCIGCLERHPDEDLDDRWLCPLCAARQDALNDLLYGEVARTPQCGDQDYQRCPECQASRYERHLVGCDAK